MFQNVDGETSVKESGSVVGTVGHGQPQPPSAAVHSSAASYPYSWVSTVIMLPIIIVTA